MTYSQQGSHCLNAPQRPTFSHFSPPYVNKISLQLSKSYSQPPRQRVDNHLFTQKTNNYNVIVYLPKPVGFALLQGLTLKSHVPKPLKPCHYPSFCRCCAPC